MAYKKISDTKTTKELLDNSTAELMAEQGGKISVRDICARAGVSVGTFYTYYKSLDEIRLERLQYMDRHLLEEVMEKLEGTYAAQLKQFLMAYIKRSLARGFSFSREVYKSILLSESTPEQAHKRIMYRLIYDIIQKGQQNGEFKSHTAAEDLADMTIAFVRGLAVDWCHKSGAYDLLDFSDVCCDIWINGLKAANETQPS